MSAPTIQEIAIADIIVRDRLRPVSAAGVASLMASVSEIGVIKDEIHVRKARRAGGTELRLMAGGHRLEVARQLGWETIRAKVWTDITDDLARLIEVDDNLAGAEMNALDTAIFLAERKRIYERLHPETRHGGDRRSGKFQTDMMSVGSSAASTAEKFGLTDRHVRRMIAAATALSSTEVEDLRGAPKPVTLADLQALSKIGAADERAAVVAQLATGEAKSAAEARRSLAAPTVLKDPVEEALKGLREAWTRAPMAARRRFVDLEWDELERLISDHNATRRAAQ